MKVNLIFYFVFVQLLIAGFSVSEAYAQTIGIDRITVLTAEEASDAGHPLHFLEIAFTRESVSDNSLLVVHKFTGMDNPPTASIDTVRIGDLAGDRWYYRFSTSNVASERFYLELLDASGASRVAATESHSSIFLQRPVAQDIDRCTGTISLGWENYTVRETIGQGAALPPFFTHNRIWVQRPGEADYEMIGEVGFETTEYEGYTLNEPGLYRFRIQSVEVVNGTDVRTSFSNFQAADYLRPTINDLDIISVDVDISSMNIITRFSASTSVAWSPGSVEDFDFDVYRSDGPGGPFELVGLGVRDAGTGDFSFTDTSVPDLSSGPYYYKVIARLEGCDSGYGMESGEVSSLFLQGGVDMFSDTQLTISLSWVQDPLMNNFQLFRKLPGEDYMLVASTSATSFVDDLTAMLETLAGEINYRLVASDGTVLVNSNEVSVLIETELDIPNAFRPNSNVAENTVFRPSLRGFIPPEYKITLFNRWGQEMFSVENPGNSWEGWDGRDADGRDVPQGVYGYRLNYRMGSGPEEEIMGTVMLIR